MEKKIIQINFDQQKKKKRKKKKTVLGLDLSYSYPEYSDIVITRYGLGYFYGNVSA
jgi:hypothetical protein